MEEEGGIYKSSYQIGLGVNVDYELLKKQDFESRLQHNIPMREDGSVGYSV